MEPVLTQEHNAHNGNGSAAAAESPFLGGGYLAEVSTGAQFSDAPVAGLVSPFAGSVVGGGVTEYEDAFEQLFNELEDESFDDAVAALVDEAAALQLSSPWAAESGTGVEQLQAWGARVTDDAHRLLEHFENYFADRTIESITEAEIDLATAQFGADPGTPATEQLFGGLGSKLKAGFKAAASAVGRLAGLGPLTAVLKKLVGPLVQRVVNTVLNRLPPALQGPARTLASRIGGQTAATATELSTDFDRQFAEALTAPNAAAVDRVLATAEEAASTPTDDPVGALGVARVRLAEDLRTATAGEAPVVQIEQFIPAVMAAMPLIRTAAKVIGRDRIKGMLATPIAAFIAPYIGSQAAGQLAPHIADAGMKLLQLEHEDAATMGLEALVTTVEETVRQVLSLPEESLADDLRVGAEVQEAFADAAARYLPARVLRADLDEAESESEGGGWVMMPRSARPALPVPGLHPSVPRAAEPTGRAGNPVRGRRDPGGPPARRRRDGVAGRGGGASVRGDPGHPARAFVRRRNRSHVHRMGADRGVRRTDAPGGGASPARSGPRPSGVRQHGGIPRDAAWSTVLPGRHPRPTGPAASTAHCAPRRNERSSAGAARAPAHRRAGGTQHGGPTRPAGAHAGDRHCARTAGACCPARDLGAAGPQPRPQLPGTGAGRPTKSDGGEGENDLAQAEEFEDEYEFDSGPAVDMLDGEQWAYEWEIDTAAGESEAGMPEVALGTLALRTPARTWSYRFTPEDLVWTAKLLVHEAGGEDNVDNAAVLWAMFNRYALFTYDDYPTFGSFIRAYSTTLQPVLRNPQAAARHMHRPPSEFVRTGGSYPGTDIPRGQLRRHLDIQKAPWSAVKRSARQMATRALTGQLPNPGIGLATQFASTRIYFRQKHGRNPNVEEWRRYTANFAKTKGWKWIGDVAELNQLKNAFFLQRPAVGLPVDTVRVLPPAAGEALQESGEWELEHEDAFEAEEMFDGEAELETLASAVTRALRAEWPSIREGLRRYRQSPGLTPDVAMEPEF
jgi:hypothetical protein